MVINGIWSGGYPSIGDLVPPTIRYFFEWFWNKSPRWRLMRMMWWKWRFHKRIQWWYSYVLSCCDFSKRFLLAPVSSCNKTGGCWENSICLILIDCEWDEDAVLNVRKHASIWVSFVFTCSYLGLCKNLWLSMLVSGVNTHLRAILMFSRAIRFWPRPFLSTGGWLPHTRMYIYIYLKKYT